MSWAIGPLEVVEGVATAALPGDPTAGGGGFTLSARVTPGSSRTVRGGVGTLTVNDRREAELVLTLADSPASATPRPVRSPP